MLIQIAMTAEVFLVKTNKMELVIQEKVLRQRAEHMQRWNIDKYRHINSEKDSRFACAEERAVQSMCIKTLKDRCFT